MIGFLAKSSAGRRRLCLPTLPWRFAAAVWACAAFVTQVSYTRPLIAEPNARPNILLIMADDVGIEGLGCYGGVSYETPHLDRLAEQGVRFTHAYSQPLCTPTRVQIMTGKYNHRNWNSFGILDPAEKTFGHYLKQSGYQTGIFGKWQLQSYDPPDLPGAAARRGTGMHPKDAGFHRYALFHALHTEDKGSRYANPTMLEGSAGSDGVLRTYSGRYGADVWVDKILHFFDAHRGEPTFVYYPMALPHWPFEPTPDSLDWDPENVPTESVDYFRDMVEYMDASVGKLVKGLNELELRSETLVLFYSDNGTHTLVESKLADGRLIRGGKATPKQTGIHVPLIANWPGHIQPSVCDDLIDASDFLPTLLDVAGATRVEVGEIDGVSFAPQLLGQPATPRESVFVWYDPRPGWDKERFGRHVFALNKTHKLFRNGRLYRLTSSPLEEVEVDPLAMNDADRVAATSLKAAIDQQLQGVDEPPLVNAYGEPEHDFLEVPANRDELNQINQQLLESGEEYRYGDADTDEHRLWLFRPLDADENETRPAVFLVHGGSWGGHPRMLAPQAVYLQRRGIPAVVIHFRAPSPGGASTGKSAKRNDSGGTPEERAPVLVTPHDTLRDVRRAYRHVVGRADEFGIDAGRIVMAGGSAGGHLSLAACTIELSDDPPVEPQPAGLVLFNPVIDLVDGWASGRRRLETFHIEPRSFSPAHHVSKGLPPTLVLSGSDDPLITPAQLRSFADRMRAAGNDTKIVIYPDAGHGFFNYGWESNRYFWATMWQFENFLGELDLLPRK